MVSVFDGVALVEGARRSTDRARGQRAEVRDDDVRTTQARARQLRRLGLDARPALREPLRTSARYVPDRDDRLRRPRPQRQLARRQPNTAPLWTADRWRADWAPYRDGSWTWIAPWGWTWVDNAPWGYAPFHYGRWVQVDQRWAWAPGRLERRPVWAPALVGWVGGAGWSLMNSAAARCRRAGLVSAVPARNASRLVIACRTSTCSA